MAKKKWILLPGGRIKRWKQSMNETRTGFGDQTPPHWYRNHLNRRERQKCRSSLHNGNVHRFPYIHPRIASWYW